MPYILSASAALPRSCCLCSFCLKRSDIISFVFLARPGIALIPTRCLVLLLMVVKVEHGFNDASFALFPGQSRSVTPSAGVRWQSDKPSQCGIMDLSHRLLCFNLPGPVYKTARMDGAVIAL